ncbi:hypothetical protein EV175_005384 [Coemansia sp. RSA 1933]|nr:hypothetical protein EV175_005384 [Coemansia sp. RSA 1933]
MATFGISSLHGIAAGLAIVYMVAVCFEWTSIKYAIKPTVTLLIAWPTAKGPSSGIFTGLLLSALGDIFIMLPVQETMFVPGLLSFLAAHILYIRAFDTTLRLSWTVATPLGIFAATMAANLYSSVANEDMAIQAGVAVYILTITLMAYKAALTQNTLLIAGSLLFCVSDSILAWDKFRASYPWCEFGTMVTYYAAQLCIAMVYVPKVKQEQQ